MNYAQQKSALTRAIKTKDREKVKEACIKAKAVWEKQGYWPDDWSRWQRALDDLYPGLESPRLEDL